MLGEGDNVDGSAEVVVQATESVEDEVRILDGVTNGTQGVGGRLLACTVVGD